jgi:hypothetical protein
VLVVVVLVVVVLIGDVVVVGVVVVGVGSDLVADGSTLPGANSGASSDVTVGEPGTGSVAAAVDRPSDALHPVRKVTATAVAAIPSRWASWLTSS